MVLKVGEFMMKTVKLTFCLSLALLYSLVLFAEPVGTLTMDSGTLKVRRNRMDTIYSDPGLRIPVENGDEIQTSFKTRARIQMTQQADTIELFPNTFFIVTGVTPETTDLSLPAGKAQFQIEKPKKKITRKKRGRFRLRTANAVIGVKGTRFVVAVLNGNTNLLTLSGIVSLANIATPEAEVVVSRNQASKIKVDRQPTAPVTVAPEVQQKIIESDSADSFEEVEFGAEVETEETAQEQATEAKEPDQEDVEELIENVNEEVDVLQEEISETQTNKRSIEFNIVDE